jgi:hypothetical protein
LLLLINLSTFSILFPTLIGGYLWRKIGTPFRRLYFFILFSLVVEILMTILAINSVNNLFLFHFFTFIEVPLISLIYLSMFHQKRIKTLIVIGNLGFLLFSVYNILWVESIDEYNSIQRTLASTIIVLILLTFIVVKVFLNRSGNKFTNNPRFILTGVLLIYYSGMLYLNVYTKEFFAANITGFWIIHSLLNIFLNISLSLTIWKARE